MQQQNSLAQLHTHVSVPYWSPDVWLGLELLRDIQFGLLRDQKWVWQPENFCLRFVHQWLNPPFWISKSATADLSLLLSVEIKRVNTVKKFIRSIILQLLVVYKITPTCYWRNKADKYNHIPNFICVILVISRFAYLRRTQVLISIVE